MISSIWIGIVAVYAVILPAFLLYDLSRARRGLRTITQWATAEWWREVLLVMAMMIGPVALLMHFLTFNGG